ncbi:hypothetical protein [Chthonobacter rhizosphaerae]|uniref:hypothetical protein n=1 Tax=Chthonobacter rhizosphaerae TaxID=2735553 RepID=UPI0015EF5309|nr:hypothetical protein [Chthonobacter rhizosphaerae]
MTSRTRPWRRAALPIAAVALAAAATVAGPADPVRSAQPDWAATDYSPRTNYVLRCSGCHGLAGKGAAAKAGVPDLAGYVGAFAADPDGRSYMTRVPGVRSANLDAARTAAVLNYVVEAFAGPSWKPGTPLFTAEEVAAAQALPRTDVVALRRHVAARLKADGAPVAPYPWP